MRTRVEITVAWRHNTHLLYCLQLKIFFETRKRIGDIPRKRISRISDIQVAGKLCFCNMQDIPRCIRADSLLLMHEDCNQSSVFWSSHCPSSILLAPAQFDCILQMATQQESLGTISSHRVKSTQPLRQLTMNDAKISGPHLTKKLDKISQSKKFQSRKFKTLKSAYTPVVHKPSNEQVSFNSVTRSFFPSCVCGESLSYNFAIFFFQIFHERKELVCNWVRFFVSVLAF